MAHLGHSLIVAVAGDQRSVVLDCRCRNPEIVVRETELRQIEASAARAVAWTEFEQESRLQIGIVLGRPRRDQNLINSSQKTSTAKAFSALRPETAAP